MRTVWLIHGWSYSPTLWDAVAEALHDAPVTLERVDLGYAGPEYRPAGIPDLVVGHSLGSLWALGRADLATVPLLAVNGFTCFAATPEFPHGVPPRGLARMIRGLSGDAAAVLAAFRSQIGDPAPLPDLPFDTTRLAAGLELLRDAVALPHVGRMEALAGEKDPLVTPEHSRACFGESLQFIAEGGHLLPLSHPTAVADAIRAMLPR